MGRPDVLDIAGPPAPETLRPSQLARRQRIVRAALRALAGSEYDRVKISEVARESGVALGTLYRYFASKEHLFAAVFVEWQGALKVKLEKRALRGDTDADRLRDVFRRTIRAFQVQPQFFRLLMVLNTTSDAYAAEIFQSAGPLFAEIVKSAFAGPPGADREAICTTINSVLDAQLRAWVMNRATIEQVYQGVDDAIRLIYEFCP
jgi:TetR/AcrR family transcriptional regulator, cholesterol catabolism regulator